MVKKYILLTNKQRMELCRLIHVEGLTIKEAAKVSGIPYPNAKAVNKIFEREKRTQKKHHKFLVAREDNEVEWPFNMASQPLAEITEEDSAQKTMPSIEDAYPKNPIFKNSESLHNEQIDI